MKREREREVVSDGVGKKVERGSGSVHDLPSNRV